MNVISNRFNFLPLLFGFSQSELVSIDGNNSAKEFRERPSKVTTKQFKEVSFECFFFYSLNDIILQSTDYTLTIIEEFLPKIMRVMLVCS